MFATRAVSSWFAIMSNAVPWSMWSQETVESASKCMVVLLFCGEAIEKEMKLTSAALLIDIYSQQDEQFLVPPICSLVVCSSITSRLEFSLALQPCFDCVCSAGWQLEEGGEDERVSS